MDEDEKQKTFVQGRGWPKATGSLFFVTSADLVPRAQSTELFKLGGDARHLRGAVFDCV